jgi:mono/diheme cytochrome c family protein
MKRRFNWLGVSGLALLLLGAVIFRSRGALVPWYLSWILGPLLWYVGGGLAIASLIQRMFSAGEKKETVAGQVGAANNLKESELKMRKAHVIVLIAVVALSASVARADGKADFTAKCQMCHGADGAGKTPMGAKLNIADLRSDAVQSKSNADLEKTIASGKNKMQGYEGKLTKQQIADVAAYVKSLKK